ncbi:aspartyl protease family protein [Spirosoma aerolatum]|uniref:aspartyl protease family protein n=1 Tax=Spirosoma aerolatum TaxID=1211326 RepID=UPI0009AE2B51|nr:aspartyl protease family protein [Spirosoma aerolatum]
MRNYLLLLVLLFTLPSQALFGQRTNTTYPYSVPFQLTSHNNLSVRAVLNEQDTVKLMFHTAANAVTLTEEALKTVKSLTFAGADSVKSWGGSNNTSRFSTNNRLQIGGRTWPNTPIWENKNSGPETDGKFGIDLFEGKVIELDFDTSRMTIHETLPSKITQYEKLKLIVANDMLFLEAHCMVGNQTLKNQFLIHSGYSGAILLDDQFVAEHKLDDVLNVISEKELKDSFGNVIKTQKAILPGLTIGSQPLANVPVGFFKGALGRQKMSILGGDILKRFNLIIDAKREYVYLKPNRLLKTAYSAS